MTPGSAIGLATAKPSTSGRNMRYACGSRFPEFKRLKMRPEHEARRTVIREWMSLPRQSRQTEEQAAAFATQATEKHKFTCSGDRHRRIMAWLLPRLAKS